MITRDLSRVEFLDGRYLERPMGSGSHSDCQFQLTRLLKALGQRHGFVARQEWSLAHGDDWLIPDIVVAPSGFKKDHRDYLASTPHLCIEILSTGQSESELFRKCQRYHSWGVPHCWVVDPATQACFEYHGGDSFTLVDPHGVLTAGDLRLPIAEIFETLI